MARTTKELLEASSFAGTFLFFNKKDAEGVAAMLGLEGAFPIQADDSITYWMPGKSYDELMNRIFSEWTLPDQATVPQAHPQEKTLPFLAYLDKTGEK
jgi:hypothetical protein